MIRIIPITADTGRPACASQSAVANLRSGLTVNGVLLVVTQGGVRIFKPATSKGASKAWNDFFCDSANVVQIIDHGVGLVGLFGDGCVKAYSLPSLKEISSIKIDHILDIRRFGDAIITSSGDVFGWSGPSEIAVLNVCGAGLDLLVQRSLIL